METGGPDLAGPPCRPEPVFRPARSAAHVDVFGRACPHEAAVLMRGMIGGCAARRAVVTASVQRLWEDGPRTPERLIDLICQAEETISALVTAYRSQFEPLREGSLLRLMLLTLHPGIQDHQITQVSLGGQDGPYQGEANPWFVRRSDPRAAARALTEALGWPVTAQMQAEVVLERWK